jgi:hypothetical protein
LVRVVPAQLRGQIATAPLEQTEPTLWYLQPDSQHKPQSAADPEHKTPSETMVVLAVAVAVAAPEVRVEHPVKETRVAKAQLEQLIQTVFGWAVLVVELELLQQLQQAQLLVASVALAQALAG